MRHKILVMLLLLAPALTGCLGVGDERSSADLEPASNTSDPAEDGHMGQDREAHAHGHEDDEAGGHGGHGDAEHAHAADGLSGPEDVAHEPIWHLGHWFGYHVFFGVNDTEGIHYDAIVVEDQGASWLVATDNQEAAKYEAVFDLHLLGTFTKGELATTSGGEPWTWYDWPLAHNKTWTATVDTAGLVGGQPNPQELTFTATYNDAIQTEDGTFPGFDVVGRTAEGNLTMEYDYVPQLGWFAHLYIYDPTTAGSTWTMHIMTMGSGEDWTGTYYVDEATEHLAMESQTSLFGPTLDPNPHATATVTEEADYVMGFAYAYGFAGAHDLRVTQPDGSHVGMTAGPFGSASHFFDEEATPGDWEVTSVGAGAATGGGIFLWEVVEHSSTM